jgi:hypothetical protein
MILNTIKHSILALGTELKDPENTKKALLTYVRPLLWAYHLRVGPGPDGFRVPNANHANALQCACFEKVSFGRRYAVLVLRHHR